MLAVPRVGGGAILLSSLKEMVRSLLGPVASLLEEAEAYGSAVLDLWIAVPKDTYIHEAPRMPEAKTHCGGELTIPAGDEVGSLADAWMREIGRSVGRPEWG